MSSPGWTNVEPSAWKLDLNYILMIVLENGAASTGTVEVWASVGIHTRGRVGFDASWMPLWCDMNHPSESLSTGPSWSTVSHAASRLCSACIITGITIARRISLHGCDWACRRTSRWVSDIAHFFVIRYSRCCK